jgi:hypothetical protein
MLVYFSHKEFNMKTIAVVLCGVFGFALTGYGQDARSVTNADLEKYRQERVAAQNEYRVRAAANGLPSPEELNARKDKQIKELVELAEKLRMADLAREYLELQAAEQRRPQPPNVYITTYPAPRAPENTTIWTYSYPWYWPQVYRRTPPYRASGGMTWPQ